MTRFTEPAHPGAGASVDMIEDSQTERDDPNAEFILTPEGVHQLDTEVRYAYGRAHADKVQAHLLAETGRGWKLYRRVR